MGDQAYLAASPYRGLEPFDESDAPFFFGRERETRLISASLFASPLTLLYGASGVGKSSVLRAGVLPRLRNRKDILPIVFPTVLGESREMGSLRGWQSDPLGGIKETVALALYRSAAGDQTLYNKLQDTVLTHEMAPLREYLTACHEASGRRLMLILDQFEEYSLYHPEDDAFGLQFPLAITPGDLSVSFLISLREDSLAKLDRFKGRIPTLWDSYRRIDHLDRAAAEDAVRLPLAEYNRRQPGSPPIAIEDDLVSAVLSQVQTGSVQFDVTGSGALAPDASVEARIETPYLQLVMMRLWERELAEHSNALRLATLNAEGGAAEIVRTHLDRVMEQFTAEERDIAARVFHRLVTPSGAKIAFSAADLAEYEAVDSKVLAPILARLEEGSRRILRRVATPGAAAEEPRYEIFHDRLGKAILSWRAKRLQEQERERRQREDAQQKRVADQSKASVRGLIDAAMDKIGKDGQALWARLLPYLVSADGKRLTQTAIALAELSQQPSGAVEGLLNALTGIRLLRDSYRSSDGGTHYEVPDDPTAAAFLDWHSQYVSTLTRAAVPVVQSVVEIIGRAATPEREFPYDPVRKALFAGKIIPFLGAGVSRTAKPPVPTGYEVKVGLADAAGFPAAEFEHTGIAEIASYFVQRWGREQLDVTLRQALGIPVAPSATHRLLASAAQSSPLTILTTNYDAVMERALDELGVVYDTINYVGGNVEPGGLVLTPHGAVKPVKLDANRLLQVGRTFVFRLNGPVIVGGRPTTPYSITEEDNIDWIVNFERLLPPFIAGIFRKTPLLSLGHSARDWTQRAMLRSLNERRDHRRTSIAISLNPSPQTVMTWQRYEVDFYNLDLDEWAARMSESA